MRTIAIEFDNWDCPSNNEVKRMNSWAYKKIIDTLKLKILHQLGEGPWPKITFERNAFTKKVRLQVSKELEAKWEKKRFVLAEIAIRRPRRYDTDNSQGGCKPLWDALQRMGWMVNDSEKWFVPKHRPQILGDHKVTVTLSIPDNEVDENLIKERAFNG